jgi:hypothetical protein
MILAGIDLSLNSPGITIYEGDPLKFCWTECYFHSYSKYNISDFNNFRFYPYMKWKIDSERYMNIAQWALGLTMDCDVIAIEGYSFQSKGRSVFQIAENGGLLKYKIWRAKIDLKIYPPSKIKKFATLKGNANKNLMYDAWLAETKFDLKKKIQPKRKLASPTSDIVDSYYILKLLAKNCS